MLAKFIVTRIEGTIKCDCGEEIEDVPHDEIVECPNCGKLWSLVERDFKYLDSLINSSFKVEEYYKPSGKKS